jgi:Uncharacterized protein conserved in bacteria (DUF2252)
MAVAVMAHPSVDERRTAGRAAREWSPLSGHGGWVPAGGRPDPVALMEAQNLTREPDLVPVRHGRMMVSPFTFYRGAAKIMATDLKDTPTAGLEVQLCGDAHLSNLGVRLHPGRHRAATMASVTAYRQAMAGFAEMGNMEIWYAHLSEQDLMTAIRALATGARNKKEAEQVKKGEKAARKTTEKAHSRDSLQALEKLGELVDGRYRIVSQPPVIVPARDIEAMYGYSADQLQDAIHQQFRAYRTTLQEDRRHLLERFEIVDMARKVVGVGSVGTRAFIVLLQGRDERDPLFLQVKEATASVLEDHLPKSRFKQPGERVVQGQRIMQAASDIYLGWTKGVEANRWLYWRQLRDMKGSAVVETLAPVGLTFYAGICGWTLARAHARSGDAIALAEYLGKSDKFDRSITDFSQRYAEQNERDYQAFGQAIRSGRLHAVEGV